MAGRDQNEGSRYVVSETRHQQLFRTAGAVPRLLQGVFPFVGRGLFDLAPLSDDLSYTVPPGATAEPLYCRAGNDSDELVYLALTVDGKPSRYVPVGPKSDVHVTLAIIDSVAAGSRIDVAFAAPRGAAGTLIVDFGMAEIRGEAA